MQVRENLCDYAGCETIKDDNAGARKFVFIAIFKAVLGNWEET